MQHVVDKEPGQKEETAIRRSNRYIQAERALTYSFQCSLEQELPTSHLQIGVLRKAISLLHIRISETADSLEKLRTVLVDRSLEPREYQLTQRQRWLAERRLLAAEELSKSLQRSLTTVPSTSAQPQSVPSVSSNAKSNENLRRFLEYPWPRASINRQNYCRHHRNDNAIARNGFSRIHRHTSLLPLTLGYRRRPPRTAPLTLPPIRTPAPSSFAASESIPHSLPSLTSSSLSNSPSTREATPLPEPMALPPITSLASPPTDTGGTATIWQHTTSFTREEILKDLVVSIPDYVNNLLAEFDSAVPAGPSLPLNMVMTNKSASNDRLPSQSEKASLSSGTDHSSIPLQQAMPPPKRRHSVLFDVVSSHIGSKSGDGQMSSRAARRRSSPPSAFPSTLTKATPASNEPPARSTTRRTSISISDLRSVFSGSASSNGPIATSTPRNSESAHSPHQTEQQPQRTSTDEKLLTRLRRRMSFLRRF